MRQEPVRWMATALALVVAVGICIAGAIDPTVSDLEASVFRAFNELPRWVGRPLESVMWLGTVLGIALCVAGAAALGKRVLASQLAIAGLIAWVTQRLLKPVVDRGRPRDLMPDAAFHGYLASGGGIPSGHTAMAVALCAVFAHRRSPLVQLGLAVLAAAIGIARMYTGNHFPLDIVSGAAIGWVAAQIAIFYVERRAGASLDSEAITVA